MPDEATYTAVHYHVTMLTSFIVDIIKRYNSEFGNPPYQNMSISLVHVKLALIRPKNMVLNHHMLFNKFQSSFDSPC